MIPNEEREAYDDPPLIGIVTGLLLWGLALLMLLGIVLGAVGYLVLGWWVEA